MPMNPSTLTTCLWFDSEAEAAMAFYVSVFPNATLGPVNRYMTDSPGGKKAGDVITAQATLMGVEFLGLNGGPVFPQSEAVSWQIPCQDQAEIDRYWDALLADGGKPSQCGWLKDKFGVSWQVVPVRLIELLEQDGETARRVTEAFMQMVKFDIAALEAAANG